MLMVFLSHLVVTESSAEEDQLLQISSHPDSSLLRKVKHTPHHTHLWGNILFYYLHQEEEVVFSPAFVRLFVSKITPKVVNRF